MYNSLRPRGLKPARLLCSKNSPGQNTGVDSHSLLQGNFSTRGSSPGLLHCRWILYHLGHQGCPIKIRTTVNRKSSTIASLTTLNPWTVYITTNCGKFFKRWEYQTTWPFSCEICMQVKKQQLEPDMEQQIGSKLAKEYVKAIYCHPVYLTYMQSTSCEMPGLINTSWNQDCWEKYQ